MTRELTLANARLVLPGEVVTGSVVLRDGVIADMAEGTGVPSGAVDCEGDLITPGFIELHTDNLERHIEPRPKVDWPHGPALLAHDAELASCGITTVFDAMRVGSVPKGHGREVSYARGLASELWHLREAGALKISHYLHLRAEICSVTLPEEMAEFGPEDRVGIVSLMDHTPGQRQFRDMTQFRNYSMGKRGMSAAQFDAHVENLLEVSAAYAERNEAAAVAAGRRYGAVLASHDDTDTAHVLRSAEHGVHMAEFPTTVEAARACHAHDIVTIMGAPNLVRGGSHSGNVSAAELAREGLLDIVSSDYVPAALAYSALLLGEIWGDLARGFATVTDAPARAAELGDRGRLEIGLRADLVRMRAVEGAPRMRGVWSQGRRVA